MKWCKTDVKKMQFWDERLHGEAVNCNGPGNWVLQKIEVAHGKMSSVNSRNVKAKDKKQRRKPADMRYVWLRPRDSRSGWLLTMSAFRPCGSEATVTDPSSQESGQSRCLHPCRDVPQYLRWTQADWLQVQPTLPAPLHPPNILVSSASLCPFKPGSSSQGGW